MVVDIKLNIVRNSNKQLHLFYIDQHDHIKANAIAPPLKSDSYVIAITL